MNCLICENEMSFHFSKTFNIFGLEVVDYVLCSHCGFVCSKTHFEMKLEKWEKLNFEVHTHYNSMPDDPNNNPPPYFEQATMFNILMRFDVIPKNNWVDWASGEGRLSIILDKCFSLKLNNYDKYINPIMNQIHESDLINMKCNMVVNSALFEHVTNNETLDSINNLVSDNGVLAIHTLVREEIPKDPNWFYLLPVHCAFHTNRSMSILMEKWGYSCSVYCLASKTWILFKNNPAVIRKSVCEINNVVKKEYLFFKEGFVDYWK